MAVTQASIIPEFTVTAGGVYRHPVAADDDDMLVTRDILPLKAAMDRVRAQFESHRERTAMAAQLFPCA